MLIVNNIGAASSLFLTQISKDRCPKVYGIRNKPSILRNVVCSLTF